MKNTDFTPANFDNLPAAEATLKRHRQIAMHFIRSYKWTEQQSRYLNSVALKGYCIASPKAMHEAFGKIPCTDAHIRPMTIGAFAGGKLKRELSVEAL